MPGSSLPYEFKEQVRTATDLVALVSESVTLNSRSGGREFVGLCPWHDDHNPSMRVYPDRQTWRCWVCDEGGDCFSWVMKREGVEFFPAMEILAGRASLEMPRRSGAEQGGGQRRERVFEVLAWAEEEFAKYLVQSRDAQVARDYLAERGFTGDTLKLFRAGFHPDDWEWLLDRAGKRFSPQELLAARLVRERRDGTGFYDDFVNRVMFPIRDERGRCVAFGGRVLPGHDKPNVGKYINSQESPVFQKSRLVYGLDLARDAIRRDKGAVVVEGYTDCMSLRQAGVENVVATLGTALTEDHVKLLRRYWPRVVLVYDGDDAGQQAAERALSRLLAQDIDLRVLTLPAGLDPADYIAKEGVENFRTLMAGAPEAWDFKVQASAERHGLDSVDARQRTVVEMLDLMAGAPYLAGTMREDIILSRLSGRLAVTEQHLRNQLKQRRSNNRPVRVDRPGPAAPTEAPEQPMPALERELLAVILTAPEQTAMLRQRIGVEQFRHPTAQRLLRFCFDLDEAGAVPSFERVTAELEDEALKSVCVKIDESARQRNLREVVVGNPQYAEELIARMALDQHRSEHQRAQLAAVNADTQPAGLTAEDRSRLRRSQEYHRARAGAAGGNFTREDV